VVEADKPFDPERIDDDAPLFGPDSQLALDSLDALQISMALQLQFDVRLEDSKEVRRVMANINTLANFLQPA
jgi:acyl carrier protein